MEADEYFQAYDALREDEHRSRITLRIGDTCGIRQIIWSSFDFMTGPEQRFVWDVVPSNVSLTPVNFSGEESSANDDESLRSSVTNNSIPLDDDDILQSDLTVFDEGTTDFSMSRFFDDLMLESRSSNRTGTITASDSDALTESFLSSAQRTLDESTDSFDSLKRPQGEKSNNSSSETEAASSPNDNVSGTPIDGLDLSTLLARKYDEVETKEEPREAETQENSNRDPSNSTSTVSTVTVQNSDDDVGPSTLVDDSGGYFGSETADVPLKGSPNDKKFDLMSRMLLDDSPQSSGHFLNQDIITLETQPDDPSDEQFISKFVLAEQICSAQLPSNPLMHKMTIVPSRNLLVGSFLFSMCATQGGKAMHALSFVMSDKRANWYMDRQTTIEQIVIDVVPRMKASISVEEWDDSIVRLTSEWTKLLEMFGALERFPLLPKPNEAKIKRTYLVNRTPEQTTFLKKAISGCLQSQGYCVVMGSNHIAVAKMLNTLVLFLPDGLQWNCLRAYRHSYSPYIRLQGIKKTDFPSLLASGTTSQWPICLIDTDRSLVLMSSSYQKHAQRKMRTDIARINAILGREHGKPEQLDFSRCRSIDSVSVFLRRLDWLPLEESVRMGFVKQYDLFVENSARAFIQYVKDESLPSPTEKSHASKSSSFSLWKCRRALDLTSDGWFNAVLARAELIQPEIAEFIYS